MKKHTLAVLAAAVLVLTAGCSGDDTSTEDSPNTADTGATETGGDGDYAFGTDRDQMAQAIEGAFGSRDGQASWDGDTLVLSIDEAAPAAMPGFTECRVLDGLLQESDDKVVQFSDVRVDCADVLN